MKNIKWVSLSLFFVLSASLAEAETLTGEVQRIYPSGDAVFFRLKGDTCITGDQYYYFKMNETDNTGKYASKNWYSMLLASAIASMPVNVKVDACPSAGNVEIVYLYQNY